MKGFKKVGKTCLSLIFTNFQPLNSSLNSQYHLYFPCPFVPDSNQLGTKDSVLASLFGKSELGTSLSIV